MHRLGADAIVVVHVGFVLFALFGAVLALRWRWMPWLHLPAAGWGAFVELSGGVCPLTPLEQELRREAGLASYEGDFMGEYVLPVVYPAGLTGDVQLALGAGLIAINAALYTIVWRRRVRS